jgi:hypothetical protein
LIATRLADQDGRRAGRPTYGASMFDMSLLIELGALFEGRSRRGADEGALNSVIDGRSAGTESTLVS